MRRNFVVFFGLFGLLAFSLTACIKDSCTSTKVYLEYTPVYKTMTEIRNMVAVEKPQSLQSPGKIYLMGNYLFINEFGKGIHVFDISNKANPTAQAFLNVPGNVDIAVYGTYLYADNFIDLVVFDLSDISNISVAGRQENVFPNNLTINNNVSYYELDRSKGVAYDWDITEREVACDEGGISLRSGVLYMEDAATARSGGNSAMQNGGTTTSGQGGSMAQFTIMDEYLYVIDDFSTMRLFSLAAPATPSLFKNVELNGSIETIFPYRRDNTNYLFLGATNGMFIYDNSNPASPEMLAQFMHINSCDPVVAEDTYAFVTLRSGNACEGFTNELQVVDIENLANPYLIKSYEMHNPHGLGYDQNLLFICDAEEGLKIYDLRNGVDNVSGHQLAVFKGMTAYDVIAYNGTVILTADNGFYLYDYSNPDKITEAGKIVYSGM